jgi:hypothetical protein
MSDPGAAGAPASKPRRRTVKKRAVAAEAGEGPAPGPAAGPRGGEAPGPPPPRKRAREPGDEEDAIIARLSGEIDAIEQDIKNNAGQFEQCRQTLSLGIVSIEAVNQKQKMEDHMQRLTQLRTDRQKVIDQKDSHLMGLASGNEEHVMLDEMRARHAKRKQKYPGDAVDATPEQECHREQMRRLASAPRINSQNCPGGCRNLVDDVRGCSVLCPDCGYVYEDTRWGVEEKNVAWDEMPRRRSGGYKPPNHFAEIIGHFQGNRSSTAPAEIVDRISWYCKRYKHKPHEIRPGLVRFFLRRMQQEENNRFRHSRKTDPDDSLKRYTDYYKHAPEIAHRLSGIPPPYMTPMQEDKVTALFPLVVAAYKMSPRYQERLANRAGRVKDVPNCMNYYYTLYKLCQLLGYDEFLPFIPLPKSTDNIDSNDDQGWKFICDMYGWQYWPTR